MPCTTPSAPRDAGYAGASRICPAVRSVLPTRSTRTVWARVLAAVARRDIADPAACVAIEELLAACEHRDGIGAGIPPGTYLANKTGWIEEVCHDVALVRPEAEDPFVLCVLTGSPLADDAGHRLVAEVTRVCWEHRLSRSDQVALR